MVNLYLDWDGASKKLIAHFPFDEATLKFIRDAPERKYDTVRARWLLPPTSTNVEYLKKHPQLVASADVKQVFARIAQDLAAQEELKSGGHGIATDSCLGYEPKTAPFAHQAFAFNLLRSRDASALFFEQGLGKTKVTVDLASYWYQTKQIDGVLVLCPSFVKSVWEKEISQHSPIHAPVFTINGQEGLLRRQKVNRALKAPFFYVVANYEEIISSVSDIFEVLMIRRKLLIVADESTRIKNRAAKTTKMAVSLSAKAHKRLILTGTPVPNSPLDFYSQFKFLHVDLGFANFKAFQNRYAVLGGFGGYEVVRYINMEELQQKVKGFSVRKTKEECLDLPEKLYQRLEVDLPKDLRDSYNRLKKDMFLELTKEQAEHGGEVSAATVITKMLRLSQIAGSTLKLEDGTRTRFNQRPKLDALEELLEEILTDGKQVIIWARFTEELRMISDKLTEMKISHSLNYGDTKFTDREANMLRFQGLKKVDTATGVEYVEDPTIVRDRVFVANAHALGMGVTLTRASYVIYYSNDYSYEARIQSEDRAHRIGQDKNVTYIDIIAKGTVDEVVIKALETKKNVADYIVDNKANPFMEDGK